MRQIKWVMVLMVIIMAIIWLNDGCATTYEKGKPTPPTTLKTKSGVRYREFVVINAAAPSAKFHSYAPYGRDEGKQIGRIPAGTKLEILDKTKRQYGGTTKWWVTWYKVKYKNKMGWISEHVTMGNIIIEK